MIDIVKVELFRLVKSKAFWIMLGIVAACPILLIILNAFAVVIGYGVEGNIIELLRGAGITNVLLQYTTMINNDVVLLAVIASSVILSREFSDGTMRNVVLANKSRAALYFAYLIVAMIVAIAYLAAFYVVLLIIVAPVFGFNASAGKAATAVFSSFGLGIIALIFMESAVCMFLFGTRKQWATILFPLLIWFLVPTLISQILEIVSSALAEKGETLSLAAQRWVPFVNMQFSSPINIDGAIAGINVMYLSVFTAVFTVSGYYTFKKADLK